MSATLVRHPNVVVSDEPDTHTRTESDPEPGAVPPLRVRFHAALRSGDYTGALAHHHELTEEDGHDPELAYQHALCLEGLARWSDAEVAYKKLAAMPGLESSVAADLGVIRCRLGVGDRAEVERRLAVAEHRAGHLTRVQAEVAFLRARLTLDNMDKPRPGPFAPEAVIWADLALGPDHIADWLPLSAVTDPSAAGAHETQTEPHRHTTTPTDPRQEAERLVRLAVEVAPDHPKRGALLLAVANFAFLNGRKAEAARGFQAIREMNPNGPEVTAATYNLGLTQFRAWALTQARAAFIEVVDRGAGTPLEGLAWWWVGRVELNVGNPSSVLKPWGIAADTGDREVESAAALGTVLIHLIEQQPEKAEKLFRRTKCAAADPHPALADAFAHYFRFDATASELRGESLAAAVRAAGYGRSFGPAGELLFGQWLIRTGRPEDAAAVFEAGAESAPGVWGVRLSLETADLLYLSGHSDAARRRYAAVAAVDADEMGTRAVVRLAEMAVRNADGARCLRLCRTAIDRAAADRDEVLRLMGRGYELLDRPREAAECFAGRTPAR